MLDMQPLQSLVVLAALIAVVFYCARSVVDAEIRRMAHTTTPRRVPLQHLLAGPEPAAAPRVHLRLVHNAPGLSSDEPYDQMKDMVH